MDPLFEGTPTYWNRVDVIGTNQKLEIVAKLLGQLSQWFIEK